MKHLFYIVSLLPLIYEVIVITRPKKIFQFTQQLKVIGSWNNYSSQQKAFTLFSLFYWIWVIIGLFSSEWIAFLALLILALIHKRNSTMLWFDGIISLVILLFTVVNVYYLHINIISVLYSLIIP